MSAADAARLRAPLEELARMHSVQPSYDDVSGKRIETSVDTLLHVLSILGIEVRSEADIRQRLIEARDARWRRPLEPVAVAWDGIDNAISIRLPDRLRDSAIDLRVDLDDGRSESHRFRVGDLPTEEVAEVGGSQYSRRRLGIPPLPHGYHHLTVSIAGAEDRSLVIAAPLRCFSPDPRRRWGVFAPLYACHSSESWGSGSIRDLRMLDDWVTSLGGSMVATLPMLSAFLDHPFDPSPYAPASRLFWNEFYVDVTSAPEWSDSAVRSIAESSDFHREVERLRTTPMVDYAGKMRLMRSVLAPMAESFFANGTDQRRESLQRFLRDRPDVEDYARFRATTEKQGMSWHQWPEAWTSGSIPSDAYDETTMRYHVYAQWLIDEQLRELAEEARNAGGGLYLDFPLGAHPDGYDVWRERDMYVHAASIGAPPDSLFTKGQNWHVPPMHPERIREQGYSYFIEAVRHHLRSAATLRLDHVMALHRLFWIPIGHPEGEGVYVRYREDEFYAILCLESHRHRSVIVGEDLGTVPAAVREEMNRHHVRRMYVLQYELSPANASPLGPVSAGVVASINTHDMPTFTSFCQGLDIDDRVSLGLVAEEDEELLREARRELVQKLGRQLLRNSGTAPGTTDSRELLEASLAFLAASDAWIVIVNLEDLWSETKPQNVPGTSDERPNWRRKFKWSIESITGSIEIREVLGMIDRLRKEGRAAG